EAQHQPVLALIDLDMSLAPGTRRTVDEVLEHLYEHCGGGCVLVHSVRADEILERKRVERIHPLAMFPSKCDGLDALVGRVRHMDAAVNGTHDPQKGAQNVTAMAGDPKIVAFVGPLNSSVAKNEIPIASDAHLAMISPSNTNPCLTKDQPDPRF